MIWFGLIVDKTNKSNSVTCNRGDHTLINQLITAAIFNFIRNKYEPMMGGR